MIDYTAVTYEIEEKFLSVYAKKSKDTKGRLRPAEACPMRTEFQRDRDRILHCKSFRRLKHKTQVFLSPEGDHYRTRLTHTLEVSQIARTIARALRMNEDLVEAIGLGHDLGHTPFGHAGERALSEMMKRYGGDFKHNEHSLRVVDVLEYNGRGMNLTHEVRDGILNHTRKGSPSTLEGKIVCLSDQIAYLNHDIDDAVRAEVLSLDDIPASVTAAFGRNHGQRINGMILDIIENSYGREYITQGAAAKVETEKLRDFMFANVYSSGTGKAEEPKVHGIIVSLFDYFLKNIDKLPQYIKNAEADNPQKVCDFIATMSDTFVIKVYEDIFVPKRWALQ